MAASSSTRPRVGSRRRCCAIALSSPIGASTRRQAPAPAPAAVAAAAGRRSPRCRPTRKSSAFSSKPRSARPTARRRGSPARCRSRCPLETLTHDAQIQTIDEYKREFRTDRGVEFDFRDSWTFNVAAYKIDRHDRPEHGAGERPSAAIAPRPAAFTWWLDDVLMDEGDRLKKKIEAPDRA